MEIHTKIVIFATLSRLADIATTFLATPSLAAEGNLLVKKLGWKYAISTILIGLIGYVNIPGGITVATISFMIAILNAGKIILLRIVGETRIEEAKINYIKKRGWVNFFSVSIIAPALISIFGMFLLAISDYNESWRLENSFAWALVLCGPMISVHYALSVRALNKSVKRLSAERNA